MNNKNMGLLLLGGAALYYLYGNGSRKLGWQDAAGNVLTTVPCGTTITFDVPGYTHVWLTQKQNGQQQFNGPFTVPMQPYTLSCVRDVGTFVADVFVLNPDGTKGTPIAQGLSCVVTK